eukprot:6199335-Pleurochrysis_carterae.AAC.2
MAPEHAGHAARMFQLEACRAAGSMKRRQTRRTGHAFNRSCMPSKANVCASILTATPTACLKEALREEGLRELARFSLVDLL